VTQAGAGANRQGDDLTRIDGIDAEAARILNAHGVTRINQIASWSDTDELRADRVFGGSNRVQRENWVGQARRLAGLETPQAGARPTNIGTAAGGAAAAAAAASVARTSESVSGTARPVQSGQAPAAPERPVQSGEAPAAPQRPVQSGEAPAAPQRPVQASGPASAVTPRAPATGTEHQPPMSPGERDPRAAGAAMPASVEGLRSVRSQALLGGTTGGAQGADDLKRIRGVGVLLEKRLNMLGYTRYAQIAAWTQADIDRVNQQLDFSGRIERENWIEQARIMATGGQTEFSRRQDRGGV
jgi:predicted flap endonuclease-1-like 5' DNA nuclease